MRQALLTTYIDSLVSVALPPLCSAGVVSQLSRKGGSNKLGKYGTKSSIAKEFPPSHPVSLHSQNPVARPVESLHSPTCRFLSSLTGRHFRRFSQSRLHAAKPPADARVPIVVHRVRASRLQALASLFVDMHAWLCAASMYARVYLCDYISCVYRVNVCVFLYVRHECGRRARSPICCISLCCQQQTPELRYIVSCRRQQ